MSERLVFKQSWSAGWRKWLSQHSSLPSHHTQKDHLPPWPTSFLILLQLQPQPGQSPLLPAESLQQPSLLSTSLGVILLEHVLLTRMVGQLSQMNIKGFGNPFSLSSLIHKILKEERTTEIILHQPASFTNATQKDCRTSWPVSPKTHLNEESFILCTLPLCFVSLNILKVQIF